MKRHIANWSKIGLGVLGALMLIEVLLHLGDPDSLNVWNPHTALGREIYRTNPKIGWLLKPNLNTSWVTRDGFEVPIKTNSMGLRDKEMSYQKPPGVYRILLLGDSFVEALQMPLSDIFPTTVEVCLSDRLGRPIEVINGGVGAYSIGDKYLFYMNEGQKFDPDLVLLSFFTEYALLDLDRHDTQRMVRLAGAYRFDVEDNQLTKTWLSWTSPQKPIYKFESFLRQNSKIYQILWHPDAKFRMSIQDLYSRLTNQVGFEVSAESKSNALPPWHFFVFADDFSHNSETPNRLLDRWQTFQVGFQQFQTAVDTNGDRLAVMIIPNKYQTHRNFRDKRIIELSAQYANLASVSWNLEQEPNQTFVNYFQHQDVPVLDLLPYFQAHDQRGGYDLYYQVDLHFNREGHYFTRDLLCDWLVDTQLVPEQR